MTEALILDMDGVIIDSEQEHYLANQKLFKKLQIIPEALDYDKFVGLSSRLMWQEIKTRFKMSQSVEKLMMLGENAIMDHFGKIELQEIPGIRDLLDYANERSMLIAVASSSPLAMIRLVVEKLAIKDYFDLLVSGDMVKYGKPHPDIYIHTAANLMVTPQNCLVIEDSYNGSQAAKKANMVCIGYQNPSSGNQDLSACDLIVDNFNKDNYEKILDYLW